MHITSEFYISYEQFLLTQVSENWAKFKVANFRRVISNIIEDRYVYKQNVFNKLLERLYDYMLWCQSDVLCAEAQKIIDYLIKMGESNA